ncbi:MAG: hypothetical protein ACK6BZ_01805 [Candidatus Kapaibacterium sp.]|jgi:hypothetical protein
MKTIKFLALIMTLFFTAIQLNAQFENNCDSDCENPIITSDTVHFYHPLFPTCKIIASYSVRRCPDGRVEIITRGVGYGSGPECSGLAVWLQTAGFEFTNHDDLWIMAYRAASEKDFQKRYNLLLSVNQGFLIECPNGYETYEMHRAQCVKFCTYNDAIGTMMWYQQITCNSSACCIFKRKICFNTTTQQMEVTETRMQTNQGANCTSATTSCPLTMQIQLPGILMPRTGIFAGFETDCNVPCD